MANSYSIQISVDEWPLYGGATANFHSIIIIIIIIIIMDIFILSCSMCYLL